MEKNYYKGAIVFLFAFFSAHAFSQTTDVTSGQLLFKSNCSACHSIGNGKVVGPDLKGVNDKRQEAWLLKWIKSSQSLIKSGDKDAIAINNEYNKIAMTDFSHLSDAQIKLLLGYIKEEGNAVALASNTGAAQQENQAMKKEAGSLFSELNILVMVLLILFFLVTLFLSRRVINISDELTDYYSNERAFFKK